MGQKRADGSHTRRRRNHKSKRELFIRKCAREKIGNNAFKLMKAHTKKWAINHSISTENILQKWRNKNIPFISFPLDFHVNKS